MSSNLHKLYKNNEELEEKGIWFDISDTTGFLLKRFGGMNSPKVKAAMALHYKPFSTQIASGTMDPKKEREILTKVFVNACMIDWKGIEIDGKVTDFSPEVAINLLVELPELTDTLIAYCSDSKNYREELGNS